MFSRIRYPEQIRGEELDLYLEAGWRCMRSAIYTSHFMTFTKAGQARIYSTIPTRLNLQGFQFSKSNRKLLRRNSQQFRLEIGQAAHFDSKKEAVNALYALQFPDKAIDDPSNYLYNPLGQLTFDTRELCLYDGGQLVAFSFFDVGKNSIYSKQGIYNPDYQASSLGYSSMLFEIDFALASGFQYYYPGYVVPGNPDFDYKHRIGPLEYFDLPTEKWLPYERLEESNIPINTICQKLSRLQEIFRQAGIVSALIEYPVFDIRFYHSDPHPFLEFPVFLILDHPDRNQCCPMIVYDPVASVLRVFDGRFVGAFTSQQEAYAGCLSGDYQWCRIPIIAYDMPEELLPESWWRLLAEAQQNI